MTKWYEREPGNTSAMRIIAMMCATVGCITVICGTVGMFLGLDQATSIAGVGAVIAVPAELAKAWQASKEHQ